MALQVPFSKKWPAGGYYRMSQYSGAIAAGVAAAAPVWTLRWVSTSYKFQLLSMMLDIAVTTAYGSAQPVNFSLYFARSYTVNATGGTAITTTQTNDQAMDSRQGNVGSSAQSLLFAGVAAANGMDCRIASTAAITAGTWTLDDQGMYSWLNGATGLGVVSNNPDVLFGYQDATAPLILRANEGLVITNDVLLGATGVITLNICMEWAEIPVNYA